MNVGGSDGRLTMSGCGWILHRDAQYEMPDRGRHQNIHFWFCPSRTVRTFRTRSRLGTVIVLDRSQPKSPLPSSCMSAALLGATYTWCPLYAVCICFTPVPPPNPRRRGLNHVMAYNKLVHVACNTEYEVGLLSAGTANEPTSDCSAQLSMHTIPAMPRRSCSHSQHCSPTRRFACEQLTCDGPLGRYDGDPSPCPVIIIMMIVRTSYCRLVCFTPLVDSRRRPLPKRQGGYECVRATLGPV